jgi:hypothetical protein
MREYSTDPERAQWQKYASDRAAAAVVDREGDAAAAPLAGAPIADSPLSMLHIRPLDWPGVSWCKGASLLKVSKGGHCEAPEGGIRGDIRGFSNDSRRRLMFTIAQVRRDAPLPVFVTLTYPNTFPTARDSKKHLAAWLRRLRRAYPGVGLIWKLEPQERGAPHYHMLVWGAELQELRGFVPGAWFDVAGNGDRLHLLWHEGKCGNGNVHCCQAVRSWRGVWSYASKYLGKTFEVVGWDKPGRYWAVVNKSAIPFGEMQRQEVSYRDAVTLQRYQRRFSHRKSRGRSLTTFCDADQWVNRLVINDGPSGTMGIGDLTDHQ